MVRRSRTYEERTAAAGGAPVPAGTVKDAAFIGNRIVYWVTLASGQVLRCQEARTVAGIRFQAGTPVSASRPPEAVVVLQS